MSISVARDGILRMMIPPSFKEPALENKKESRPSLLPTNSQVLSVGFHVVSGQILICYKYIFVGILWLAPLKTITTTTTKK